MCKEINDAALQFEVLRVIFENERLYRSQASEGAFLELQDLVTVGGTSLWIEDQWWVDALFTLLLSLSYLRDHILLLIFFSSINEQASATVGYVTYEWYLLDRGLGHVTGWLSVHVHHDV